MFSISLCICFALAFAFSANGFSGSGNPSDGASFLVVKAWVRKSIGDGLGLALADAIRKQHRVEIIVFSVSQAVRTNSKLYS